MHAEIPLQLTAQQFRDRWNESVSTADLLLPTPKPTLTNGFYYYRHDFGSRSLQLYFDAKGHLLSAGVGSSGGSDDLQHALLTALNSKAVKDRCAFLFSDLFPAWAYRGLSGADAVVEQGGMRYFLLDAGKNGLWLIAHPSLSVSI